MTEQPSGWSTAADASLGLVEAVGTLGWEAGKFAILNTGTLGTFAAALGAVGVSAAGYLL